MIGDDAFSSFLDNVFGGIADAISTIIKFIFSVLLSNKLIALITFLVLINLLAIVLMKKDKELANTPGARRIRERTLLLTAFIGGAFGEYYAMYKFKHKTLHKKFIYGVPLAMVFYLSIITYNFMLGILS